MSNSGEGAYYFIEQFVWWVVYVCGQPASNSIPLRLVKAGVLPPRMAASLSKASAWAEAVGYVASITLNALRVAALLEREHALVSELCRMTKVCACCLRMGAWVSTHSGQQVTGAVSKEDAADILREVSVLRSRRTLRTLAIVQDCADMLLAVNDIKGMHVVDTLYITQPHHHIHRGQGAPQPPSAAVSRRPRVGSAERTQKLASNH